MPQQPLNANSPAKTRIPEIIKLLHQTYPDAKCELNFNNPLELLIATILSAQCTDERVNKVTPKLFATYPDAQAYAKAEPEELEAAIRSTGFYHNKAKNIQAACRRIEAEYGGEVPANMDDLISLNGVARKTANVVLGSAFQIADGIVVDTHIKRLSNRLGLTNESNPDKIERDLMKLVPRSEWIAFGHQLVLHGRRVCAARKPDCPNCTLNQLCPAADL